jgi:threonine/homoserine/homoserine lactone efflux protein
LPVAIFFLEGIVIGFSIAAPIGPIGLLCIQRTIARGRSAGLVTGLGAASADAFYATLGASGLAIATAFLISEQLWIRLVGGAFLVFLGTRTAFRKPTDVSEPIRKDSGLTGAYASTLGLTLTNPSTIISFAAIFAGLGLVGQEADLAGAAAIVTGVFAGSVAWWVVLSSTVNAVRRKFTPRRMRFLNVISGALIAGFGMAAILSLVI